VLRSRSATVACRCLLYRRLVAGRSSCRLRPVGPPGHCLQKLFRGGSSLRPLRDSAGASPVQWSVAHCCSGAKSLAGGRLREVLGVGLSHEVRSRDRRRVGGNRIP